MYQKHFLFLWLFFKNKQKKILREKKQGTLNREAVIKELVSCLMADDNGILSSKSEGQV